MRITRISGLAAVITAAFMFVAGPALSAGTELWWLGQSAFRITTPGGKVIVIDPFITKNPNTPAEHKDLKKLGKVDLILVTHAHGDHLGDAPTLAKMHNVPVWGPPGLASSLAWLGVLPAKLAPRMNKGGVITPLGPDIKITMVRAEHSSELTWKNPRTGRKEIRVGGEPAGFIIELENGFKIYHMGDTTVFADMKFIAEYYLPDLILIPIGGHYVMSPKDAAYATNTLLRPRYAIPIHYGTIPVLKGTPQEYLAELGDTATQVIVMNPGDTRNF